MAFHPQAQCRGAKPHHQRCMNHRFPGEDSKTLRPSIVPHGSLAVDFADGRARDVADCVIHGFPPHLFPSTPMCRRQIISEMATSKEQAATAKAR
jgi:hypothetical protein